MKAGHTIRQTLEIDGLEPEVRVQWYGLSKTQILRRMKLSGPNAYELKARGKAVERVAPNARLVIELLEGKHSK